MKGCGSAGGCSEGIVVSAGGVVAAMGCASSTPLTATQGPSPDAPQYDLRAADPGTMAGDGSVAGKVRQTVTGMADALPVQEMIDGVTHVKDEAFHKLQDFGETVKDKVESVVEDVEDKIGSALGTVKEKTTDAAEAMSEAQETAQNAMSEAQETAQNAMSEAQEEMSDAKEEMNKAMEQVEEVAESKVDEAKDAVDTMVEDLEESLPLPEEKDKESENKDFQINASKGSRASTAELSRKSNDEIKEKEETEEVKGDEESSKSTGSDGNLQHDEEESISEEQRGQSPQNKYLGKSSPASSEGSGFALQAEQTLEDNIVANNSTPVEAVPIDKNEIPQEESKDEKKEQELTVDLPPEKERSSSGDNGTSRQECQNQSPPPPNDTPRPSDENEGSIEPLVEKTTITHPESQPDLELEIRTRSPSSPEGKNDSAISSSSLSPEQELAETEVDERQGTPVVEVA